MPVNTYTGNGHLNICVNGDGGPSYFPNQFHGLAPGRNAKHFSFALEAKNVDRVDTGNDDNFSKMAEYWKEEMDQAMPKLILRGMAKSLA